MFAALRDWFNEDLDQLRLGKGDGLDIETVLEQEARQVARSRVGSRPKESATQSAAAIPEGQAGRPETGPEPTGIGPGNGEPDGFIGLALSGGGIRSATFCLGVLQALARERRLGAIDYLSTVSGGGYIGGWLSAWIHRSGLARVEDALARERPCGGLATESGEPTEVTRLRKLSNYLSPRLGLFSLDSLTLIATWLRNVLLNLLLLSVAAAAVLIVPRLLVGMPQGVQAYRGELGAFSLVMGILALVGIAYNLVQQEARQTGWLTSQAGVFWTVVAPALLGALLAGIWMESSDYKGLSAGAWTVVSLAVVLFVTLPWIALSRLLLHRTWPRLALETSVYGLAFAVAISLVLGLFDQLHAWWVVRRPQEASLLEITAEVITFGPAGVLLVFGLGTGLFVGLAGRLYQERSREWWSRLTAWLLALGTGWLLVCALALYAPALIQKAFDEAPAWLAGIVGSGWVGSAILAVLGARLRPSSPLGSAVLQRSVRAAAILFSIGLVLVLAWATHLALIRAAGFTPDWPQPVASQASFSLEVRQADTELATRIEHAQQSRAGLRHYLFDGLVDLERLRKARQRLPAIQAQAPSTVPFLWAAFVVLLASVVLLGLRVDVNTFSLHNMYKNRLIRCYLGASNRARCPGRFTGFDDDDDLPLAALARQRPFHLVNAAINITYGRNLAWQERMAGPFTFSGLHCGTTLPRSQGDDSARPADPAHHSAYRPAARYGAKGTEKDGFTLGMAMTTSGAAVSPTRGPGTTPAVAFILTLLNGRLGRWSPNPFQRAWERASPRLSIAPLLQELFGFADERRRFVYLSDGGFFDNLGLYELVRRRCRVIVAVDATADERRLLGDLGEAIRKCRIDLGVEIELEDEYVLQPQDERKRAIEGFSKGRIRYRDGREGVLLYLKPTLRIDGEEPADVLSYAARNPAFPHQTTVDQFFSESQFESYRKLGAFIGSRCLALHGAHLPPVDLGAVAPDDRPAPVRTVQASRDETFRRGLRALRWPLAGVVAILATMCAVSRVWLSSTCLPSAVALLAAPRAPAAVWLWMDFFLVAAYTALFISGYRLASLRFFPSNRIRLRILLLAALFLLSLAGAGTDLMENLLLLGSLGTSPAGAATAAAQVQPWADWKLRLGMANAVLVAVGLLLAQRRGTNRRAEAAGRPEG